MARLDVPSDPTDLAAWRASLAICYPASGQWTRLRHSEVSATRAHAVAQTRGLDPRRASALELAALLHDCGRVLGPDVRRHHAVAGAELVADSGLPEVAALIAQHTGALAEAELLGQEQMAVEIMDSLPTPDVELLALLTWINATTGGGGYVMTPRQRLADIVVRRGPDSAAAVAFRSAAGEIAKGEYLARSNQDGSLRPRLLVLDAGGVLLTDPMPALFSHLARISGRPRADLVTEYQRTIRDALWTGRLGPDVGLRFAQLAGLPSEVGEDHLTEDHITEVIEAHLRPFHGVDHLAEWAEAGQVWILSNHRRAWLEGALERYGLAQHISRVFVSDELGVAKPDPAMFDAVLREWPGRPDEVMLADDHAANMTAAQHAGMFGLYARGGAEAWVDEVGTWLAAA